MSIIVLKPLGNLWMCVRGGSCVCRVFMKKILWQVENPENVTKLSRETISCPRSRLLLIYTRYIFRLNNISVLPYPSPPRGQNMKMILIFLPLYYLLQFHLQGVPLLLSTPQKGTALCTVHNTRSPKKVPGALRRYTVNKQKKEQRSHTKQKTREQISLMPPLGGPVRVVIVDYDDSAGLRDYYVQFNKKYTHTRLLCRV